MKVAIHGRRFKPEVKKYITEIFDRLRSQAVEILVSDEFESALDEYDMKSSEFVIFRKGDNLRNCLMILSVGGDGTLLDTVTYVSDQRVPILGINTGRLGFLATTPKENIGSALNEVFSNNHTIELRSMIKLETNQDLFGDESYALNDFTILKKDSSSMITVHAYLDGDFLNSFWADGLIVSTPTGSTGYSLSCGGPLVLPHSNNFVITPVSPHNLYARPIIVSDSSVLSFEIEGRDKNYLVTLDSRSRVVESSVKLVVRKQANKVHLIKVNEYNFLDTLRKKLNWGLDYRN